MIQLLLIMSVSRFLPISLTVLLSFLERIVYIAENAVVYTKYLLTVCDYKSALELSDFYSPSNDFKS